MLENFKGRYLFGIPYNVIVNNISNDKIFKQQGLKKEHLTHLRVMVPNTSICGDNT